MSEIEEQFSLITKGMARLSIPASSVGALARGRAIAYVAFRRTSQDTVDNNND